MSATRLVLLSETRFHRNMTPAQKQKILKARKLYKEQAYERLLLSYEADMRAFEAKEDAEAKLAEERLAAESNNAQQAEES